jgi:hypothetical protein
MTLSTDKPFNSHTYGPGIYINEVTIANVEDMSGQMTPFMDRPYDIGFKLILDIGRDFQPELVIAGNFKRDQITDEVIGWGSAYVVQEALTRLGYKGSLDNGNSLPVNVLETFIGQKILRLAYISGTKDNGKFRYSDWNNIATLDEGGDNLFARFKKSLAKGYPKNYRPALLDAPIPNIEVTELVEEEVF